MKTEKREEDRSGDRGKGTGGTRVLCDLSEPLGDPREGGSLHSAIRNLWLEEPKVPVVEELKLKPRLKGLPTDFLQLVLPGLQWSCPPVSAFQGGPEALSETIP